MKIDSFNKPAVKAESVSRSERCDGAIGVFNAAENQVGLRRRALAAQAYRDYRQVRVRQVLSPAARTAGLVGNRHHRAVQVELPAIIARLPGGRFDEQIAGRLVRVHPVGQALFVQHAARTAKQLVCQFARFQNLAFKKQFPNPRQVLVLGFDVATSAVAAPQPLVVQCDPILLDAAKYHRPQHAVSDRQALFPFARRSPIPQQRVRPAVYLVNFTSQGCVLSLRWNGEVYHYASPNKGAFG